MGEKFYHAAKVIKKINKQIVLYINLCNPIYPIMSKAAQAIDQLIRDKENEINEFIRDHKEIMIEFANLKSELADMKQRRFTIARNRITALLQSHPATYHPKIE